MKQADGVIYLHGAPGGPLELQLFGDPAGDGGARFHAPDRSTFAPDLAFGAYIDRLAEDIAARFDGSLRLVGFSMGTFIALNLAQRLGDRISRIDLVSSAAPLSTGDYLPAMAGAAVFRMARTQQKLFSAVSRERGGDIVRRPGRFEVHQAPGGRLQAITTRVERLGQFGRYGLRKRRHRATVVRFRS